MKLYNVTFYTINGSVKKHFMVKPTASIEAVVLPYMDEIEAIMVSIIEVFCSVDVPIIQLGV